MMIAMCIVILAVIIVTLAYEYQHTFKVRK